MSQHATDSLRLPGDTARPGIARGPLRAGLTIVTVAIGGFLLWSALAPLSSAAIARGSVMVDSHRKTIQHLEGGIVKDILVRDGQKVVQGDILVRLDDTQARASLAQIEGRYLAALAREARLRAEQAGQDRIAFPRVLMEGRNIPEIHDIMLGQENIFAANRQSLLGQIDILEKRIAQSGKEIQGRAAAIRSADEQLALIKDELDGVQSLYAKGLTTKPRLVKLQREMAAISGDRGGHVAEIAESRDRVAESRAKILDLRNTQANRVATDLREVQDSLAELKETMTAARDVLARTAIRAPEDGIVLNTQVHTPGGVIGAGEPLLDLMPQNDRMVVDARIDPRDIDVVRPGLPARIRLSAYKHRTTPTLDGAVVDVSADALVDEKTGDEFYLARIEVAPEALKTVPDVELYPGMPAEAMIVTGEGTVIDYLMSPVNDLFARA
ncbi:MAG: HlyD family type I secretion periplasmic adaptor subunit, partial [Alphaproteobacteria bacterium]